MTAIERARALGWDIVPVPRILQNPNGRIIHDLIKDWNAEAIRRSAQQRSPMESAGDLRSMLWR